MQTSSVARIAAPPMTGKQASVARIAAPPMTGVQVAKADVRFGSDFSLVAGKNIGDAAGYASVDGAIAAARQLTASDLPGAVVWQPRSDAGAWLYQLDKAGQKPFALGSNGVQGFEFERTVSSSIFFKRVAQAPDVRALVDGDLIVRNHQPAPEA